MKRILTMIALAVLSAGLLGSCTKNIEERLDKTDASVAELKAAIGQYEKLQSDINAVIQTLRAEVGNRPASEQRTIWDCINALQNQKGTFEAAIAALNDLIGDDAVSVQIDEAVAELISEYHLDSLAADIQAIRDKLNEKSGISALADEVSQLQKRAESIARILSVIGAYEDMIQSVRINPAYADGSVKAELETLSFTFTVTPAEAISGVKNLAGCLKLYADKVEVKTKAGAFAEIPVTKAEIIDKAKGEVSVEADITKFLPKEKTDALSIALNVKTGVSNYTTEFVTVTILLPPEGALPGRFTVNAEGKQVYFSKGNLYYDGSAFKFETNQYDFQNTWSTSHVSHFFWSKTASIAYADSYKDNGAAAGDVFFTNATTETAKADFTVNGVTGQYRTLSAEEWKYLINNNDDENIRKGKYKCKVKVCENENCLVLAPDNFTGEIAESYDVSTWTTAEAAGLVCLPAAGYRKNSSFTVNSTGSYWYSSSKDKDSAYYVYFNQYACQLGIELNRDYGFSVRLVADVK